MPDTKVTAAAPGNTQERTTLTTNEQTEHDQRATDWSTNLAAKQWEDLRRRQSDMIEEVRWKVERYKTQEWNGIIEANRDITSTQFQDYLDYLQDIRDQDEATHATPALAHAALDGLTKPTH